ncbi:MAG: hypothetical protein Q8R72_03850 [Hylemonella sp.]|nr:hypothetical protein [Hylemonella sp.]
MIDAFEQAKSCFLKGFVLWGEQGVGDQILYASVLNDLVGLRRKKLVAVDKRLIPLFRRSMPSFDFPELARPVMALTLPSSYH